VEVHGQHAVGTGGLDKVSQQASRNRHTGLVLLVAATVGEVRDHGRDATRRRAAEGIDHDQELHDRSVHGRAKRLNDKNVLLTDVFLDANEEVFVTELENVTIAERHAELGGHLTRELKVRPSTEDRHIRVHEGASAQTARLSAKLIYHRAPTGRTGCDRA
jgi:hypothetical protein